LKGCCGTAAGVLAGGHISGLAFGAPGRGQERDILVTVFLRGGMDGLSLVMPYDDPNYVSNRSSLRVLPPGQQRGALDLERGFGLHPDAFYLHQLYQAGTAAFVVASGSPDPSRSHFDSEVSMERGTPGRRDVSTGWLGRHLMTSPESGGIIPVLATSSDVPTSLVGADEVANLTGSGSFEYGGHWSQIDFQYLPLRQLYTGDHWLQTAGSGAMDILDRISATDPGSYVPNLPPGLQYPGGSWGASLETIAQLTKLDLGLRIATVDLGGWDTHENQFYGQAQGWFADNAYDLAEGLAALYTDLANSGYGNRITIVVMSEFGRRVKENESRGTDHGHGNVMIVVSGNLIRSGVFGAWNGLSNDALDEGKDLPILNDYRQVLGEILVRRLNNPNLPFIFPRGPAYAPLNMFLGDDLPIGAPVPAVTPGLAVAGVALGVGATLAWRDRRLATQEQTVSSDG
jgi:uncharacterized protein (DUF1501 family)